MNRINLLVSVVIPVYNTYRYLENCLLSVQNQSYKHIEVIIIDDGSPDDSYKVAEIFVKEDQRFKLIRQNNSGLSATRNAGIQIASGDFIIFLDSDDQLKDDAIEKLVKQATSENAEMVVPDRYLKIFEGKNKSTLEYHFISQNHSYKPIDFALQILMGLGRAWRATAVLYYMKIIKSHKIYFPDSIISEDFVFNLRIISKIKRISIYSGITLFNLKRQGSITTTFTEKLIDSYLILDQEAQTFIQSNDINPSIGKYYRDSALCRNVVVYLTFLLSNQNQQSFLEKLRAFKLILKNPRINNAFLCPQKSTPYFNNKIVVFYFRMVFYLIRHKLILPAFFLTLLAGKISR